MNETRESVRKFYGEIGAGEARGCCAPTCCSGAEAASEDAISRDLGYGDELSALPEGANLGLGCGNPMAIAALSPGEYVLDLGSGGGIDALLAANRVGPTGRVIGVDMTPSMIDRARANAAKANVDHVEFRLGEIENLPVADSTVDAVISNCVVNLSDDKARVWREVFRVLKPKGRLAISDVLAERELPQHVIDDVLARVSCVAGASTIPELTVMLEVAGFTDIRVVTNPQSREFIQHWVPDSGLEDYVVSATIEATKP